MLIQHQINELKGCIIHSASLGGLVENYGGLFFREGEQINLTEVEINQLYSEKIMQDLQPFNEFKEGCFYEL